MPSSSSLVIVGASHAGTQLASTARELGFDAPIVLLGDERHGPYQRPPLSKGLLADQTTVAQLALRGPEFYARKGIDLRLGKRVEALDLDSGCVRLADGTPVDYGWLALTTGARCRMLQVPGSELLGVHVLRTLDDALAVQKSLGRCRSACIVGGGFIGLEVAGTLAAAGARVCVIESQPRLLARAFPPFISDYVAAAHRQRGVTLELGRAVRALNGREGHVEGVLLDDGRVLNCDLVVIGIGVIPNMELAQAAGIACGDGILVDALGRTSAPNVLAAGDVASMEGCPFRGTSSRTRLESIQAASDGARAAASGLVGRPEPVSTVPWFWSDQHDLNFQMAGLAAPGDQTVVRGALASDRFTVFYLRGGIVAAAHSVNRPAEHMLARRLISRRARIHAEVLADASADLKPFSIHPSADQI